MIPLCRQVNSWLNPASNPWETAAGQDSGGMGARGAKGEEEDLSSHVTAAMGSPLQLVSSLRNREFHGFETPKTRRAAGRGARGGEAEADGRDPLGIRDASFYDGFQGANSSPAAGMHQHASGAVTHRAVLQEGVEEHVPADKPWLKRLNAMQRC